MRFFSFGLTLFLICLIAFFSSLQGRARCNPFEDPFVMVLKTALHQKKGNVNYRSLRDPSFGPLLSFAQSAYGWLSPEVIRIVANVSGFSPQEVRVAAQAQEFADLRLRLEPREEIVIRVCERCNLSLADKIDELVTRQRYDSEGPYPVRLVRESCVQECGQKNAAKIDDYGVVMDGRDGVNIDALELVSRDSARNILRDWYARYREKLARDQ